MPRVRFLHLSLVLLLVASVPLAAQTTSPLPSKTVLTFVPHIVTGGASAGGYVTQIFLTNLSTASNSIVINIINQDGTLASSGQPQILAPGASFQFSTGEANRFTNQLIQWVAIGSDAPVAASVLFDYRVAAAPPNETLSAVGVPPRSPGTSFLAPFSFQLLTDTQPVLVEGLAVANRSALANTITVQLLDQNGMPVSSDVLPPLPPYGQAALTVSDLPHASMALQGQSTFFGSLSVTGTQQFAPLFVGNLGGRLFSMSLAARGGTSPDPNPNPY